MSITATKSIPIEALNELDARDLLAWVQVEYGRQAGIVTSFQNTGCVIIDIAREVAPDIRIMTIDTLRLHPETYDHIAAVEKHYGIRVERFTPKVETLINMIRNHGEYLFFDSKPKQEYCCNVRKVEPNRRALSLLDVWITGLRRDQSAFRADTPKASMVTRDDRELLRLCPLADWTEAQVEAYIDEKGIPRNVLYEQGYPSIGCHTCSTPIQPGEDKRAGRWRWFNKDDDGDKKECGIHVDGSGI